MNGQHFQIKCSPQISVIFPHNDIFLVDELFLCSKALTTAAMLREMLIRPLCKHDVQSGKYYTYSSFHCSATSHTIFLPVITTHDKNNPIYTVKSKCGLIFILMKIFLNTELIFSLLKKMDKEHLQTQLQNLATMLRTERCVTHLHRRFSWQ